MRSVCEIEGTARVNIALFPSAYFPSLGGVEELTRQLAHEYRRAGHGVVVVTNRWPRNLPRHEVLEGIPLYRIPMRVPEGSLRVRLNCGLTRGLIVRELLRILRQHQTDILHIQCVSSNGYYALRARAALGLPLVSTLQGELTMDASGLYQRFAYARALLRRVLDESDCVTACSAKTLSDGEAFFGRPLGERGHVVFNGARLEDFAGPVPPYSHPRPYILALGRLVPQKGFDVLLRAFALAQTGGHDLIIAGDGPEAPALEALAAELGVAERVYFPGRADRARAVALFRGAAFLVLSSRADEGLPVVCAEGLAAGLPIIATRSGGAPEAVEDGANGLLVEKENVPQLAAAITRLAGDPAMRRRFAQAAQARAADFAWPRIARQYLELYAPLLAHA